MENRNILKVLDFNAFLKFISCGILCYFDYIVYTVYRKLLLYGIDDFSCSSKRFSCE